MDMQRAPPPTGEEEGVVNMEGNGGAAAKRLWHIVRVVYYMIRKGLSKRKLMMELHLLFKRGKIAGKAIGNLMFHHHHHHHHQPGRTQHVDDPHRPDHHYSSSAGAGGYYAAFTCRSMDPNLSYYNPREVEFSCSNTPSYPFHLNKRKRHHHHHHRYGYDYDVATVRKALEIINSQLQAPESPDAIMATPSPAAHHNFWGFFPAAGAGKSPMVSGGRQLRITDSPFPIEEEGDEADGQVDSKAEEFIKHFREQLRMQKTPTMEPRRYRRQAVYG